MLANDDAEARLVALGVQLPPLPTPIANYLPFRLDGNTIYLAGQGPRHLDGALCTGKVGADVSVADAYQHARLIGTRLLSAARAAAGSLGNVQAVKVFGMINATPDFVSHPDVINGCSDLFVDVLGEFGQHARSVVGVNSLSNNMSMEIEAIFRIRG